MPDGIVVASGVQCAKAGNVPNGRNEAGPSARSDSVVAEIQLQMVHGTPCKVSRQHGDRGIRHVVPRHAEIPFHDSVTQLEQDAAQVRQCATVGPTHVQLHALEVCHPPEECGQRAQCVDTASTAEIQGQPLQFGELVQCVLQYIGRQHDEGVRRCSRVRLVWVTGETVRIGAHRETPHRGGQGSEHGRHVRSVQKSNVEVHLLECRMLETERLQAVAAHILCAHTDGQDPELQCRQGRGEYLSQCALCTAIVSHVDGHTRECGQRRDPIRPCLRAAHIDVVVREAQGQSPDARHGDPLERGHDAGACIVTQFTALQSQCKVTEVLGNMRHTNLEQTEQAIVRVVAVRQRRGAWKHQFTCKMGQHGGPP